jgi:hypothetical protein
MRRGLRQCKHLGLWELTPRPPPRIAKAQPTYSSWQRLRPPQSSGPQHDVPSLPLTHKAKSPIFRPSETEFCYVDCQAIFREAPFSLSSDSWRCSWQRSSRVASWARMGPLDGSSERRKQPCGAQLYDCYPNETTFTQPAIRGHKPQEIYSL